jgi:hypothetical protein
MDVRLQQLSYSSILTKHECPRKFQLSRLRGKVIEEFPQLNNTFTYGHVVGLGVQLVMTGVSMEEIYWQTFNMWNSDLLGQDEKQKKSYWEAIYAIRKFIAIRDNGLFEDYELVYYQGMPATELGWRIHLPQGFKVRGYVDAVLRHKYTGEIVVLEVKTTSMTNLNPALYKNSQQAIGYSIVLDKLFEDITSYKVIYLVYQTKSQEWTQLPFVKNLLQRAQWLQQLAYEVDDVIRYENAGVYPIYGESCLNWNRECEFFGICSLNTEHLTTPITQKEVEFLANEKYTIEVTFEELIQLQLRRT